MSEYQLETVLNEVMSPEICWSALSEKNYSSLFDSSVLSAATIPLFQPQFLIDRYYGTLRNSLDDFEKMDVSEIMVKKALNRLVGGFHEYIEALKNYESIPRVPNNLGNYVDKHHALAESSTIIIDYFHNSLKTKIRSDNSLKLSPIVKAVGSGVGGNIMRFIEDNNFSND